MSVTAPPRPPNPTDPVDRDELETLVEALIEEARRRARRRRLVYAAVAASAALVGVTVFAIFDHTAQSRSGAPSSARPSLAAPAAQSSRGFDDSSPTPACSPPGPVRSTSRPTPAA